MAMSRLKSLGGPNNVGKTAVDEKLYGLYPELHEFLTETSWDDGKPRKTGTLLIMADNGWWKAFVHDRDGRCGAFVTAGTVDLLMSAVEAGLAAGDLDMRPDKR